MKKYVALILALLLALLSVGCTGNKVQEVPEDFSFALKWTLNGTNSYDSATGILIRADGVTSESYTTSYELTEEEKATIYRLLMKLDADSYPDGYDPHKGGKTSDPPLYLTLTIRTGDTVKTIKTTGIAFSYTTTSLKGQKFLTACKTIQDILLATEEWNSLTGSEGY